MHNSILNVSCMSSVATKTWKSEEFATWIVQTLLKTPLDALHQTHLHSRPLCSARRDRETGWTNASEPEPSESSRVSMQPSRRQSEKLVNGKCKRRLGLFIAITRDDSWALSFLHGVLLDGIPSSDEIFVQRRELRDLLICQLHVGGVEVGLPALGVYGLW